MEQAQWEEQKQSQQDKEVANKIRNAKRNLEKKLAYAEGGKQYKNFCSLH